VRLSGYLCFSNPELESSGVPAFAVSSTLRFACLVIRARRHFAVRGTPTTCVSMGATPILGLREDRNRVLRRQQWPQRSPGRRLLGNVSVAL